MFPKTTWKGSHHIFWRWRCCGRHALHLARLISIHIYIQKKHPKKGTRRSHARNLNQWIYDSILIFVFSFFFYFYFFKNGKLGISHAEKTKQNFSVAFQYSSKKLGRYTATQYPKEWHQQRTYCGICNRCCIIAENRGKIS